MHLPKILFPTAAATVLAASSIASAAVPHTVGRGESLYSVAAADGLSVDQLAAANGLSPNAQLIAGRTLMIPPQGGAAAGGASVASGGSVDGDGDTDGDAAGSAAPVSSGARGGSYMVQPGDTLSGIAARSGMSTSQLAADNGLSVNGLLRSGTALNVGGASTPSGGAPATPSPQPAGGAGGGPYPTAETVTPQQVGQVAASDGVSPSLAEAIAQQESGFNNAAVSPTGATGVMQIEPQTWNWIDQTLSGQMPLAPSSALSNIQAGVLYLRSLLNSTGGNPSLAAAGYYQGLPSVQRNGLFPSTQQYVSDVMALRQRFGGG